MIHPEGVRDLILRFSVSGATCIEAKLEDNVPHSCIDVFLRFDKHKVAEPSLDSLSQRLPAPSFKRIHTNLSMSILVHGTGNGIEVTSIRLKCCGLLKDRPVPLDDMQSEFGYPLVPLFGKILMKYAM